MEDTPKKKRRRSEKSSSSSMTVTLKEMAGGGETGDAPPLVSFPGGVLPTDWKGMDFSMHQPVGSRKKRQRVLVSEETATTYFGTNYGPQGKDDLDLAYYYVGVLDKETREMEVYPSMHAYSLRQSLNGVDSTVADFSLSHVSAQDRRASLISAFGSKKKQAAVRSARSNIIDSDRVVGGGAMGRALQQALQEGKGASGAASGALGAASEPEGEGADPVKTKLDAAARAVTAARRSFLPPYHEDSATPEGVYLVSELVGEEAWDVLDRQLAEEVQEGKGDIRVWLRELLQEAEADPAFPTFVRAKMAELVNPTVAGQRDRLLQLLYLRHLLAFTAAPSIIKNTPRGVAQTLGIPDLLANKFLSKFAACEKRDKGGKGTFVKTKSLKDKAHVHVLCLALVLSGCKLSYTALANDLKLSSTATAALLRELGCSTTSGGNASLKVPLTFPKRKMNRAA